MYEKAVGRARLNGALRIISERMTGCVIRLQPLGEVLLLRDIVRKLAGVFNICILRFAGNRRWRITGNLDTVCDSGCLF